MSFEIKNIDRAIEWALRDQVIDKGYWPDERQFIIDDDKDGFVVAVAAQNPKIDVYGTGNFKDREKLEGNHMIINRIAISPGDVNFADPYAYEQKLGGDYKKVFTGHGTHHVIYEIRFVCDDVAMDRVLNMILIESLGRRADLHGMNDDLTKMDDTFLIEKIGTPVNMSDNTMIERVFRFIVHDVMLNDNKVVEENVPMIREMGIVKNIDIDRDPDVSNPKNRNDVVTNTIDASAFMRSSLHDAGLWNIMSEIRLYANNLQMNALKNLRYPSSGIVAVNHGLTFTVFKGFTKTGVNQYLDTKYKPTDGILTNFSYSVFITEVPTSGLMELFGLTDLAQTVVFKIESVYDTGDLEIIAAANQNEAVDKISLEDVTLLAGTLYTLNRRDRFQMELWEDGELIGVLPTEPTFIPDGTVAELGVLDQNGAYEGVSAAGGIGFSAVGPGLSSGQIRGLNAVVKDYMTRVGVITE